MESEFETVLPGDVLTITNAHFKNLKLGPGLHSKVPISQENSDGQPIIFATRAGSLKNPGKNKYLIESRGQRYVPTAQESVVGVVTARLGEAYRVDIGSAHSATLDALAFESATKRNRPNLKVGSLVYARVSLANKDLEPELECFDAQTRKAAGFGELKGGMVVKCSLGMARRLFDPSHFLLPLLGSKFALEEVALGLNGRLWFKAPSVKHTIAVARCIETVDDNDLDAAATQKLLNTFDI
ncbi:hypothetical protein CPB86DRAFT_785639 [Serendipita vermifera]|nr:hypothetical protein CPB86DRAFT_785639 [Serendipita vermifera]